MAPNESFDPRTWTRGWEPSGRPLHPNAPQTTKSGTLGFALAGLILLGGAVAAYATRADTPAIATED